MATKLASFSGPNPHTSGLFADMTVDGPEIGTLVLVVDRAKNLPNRKTMGKQNPYCAARLGKEAKKTNTDQRGGQTPKWDQELRFTVHDSPDYYKIKISIFSEDKRTDLIGEAWVNLAEVIVPGGGKGDFWQGMNYKGKYAGELRIELTYYDTRPKPENVPESVSGMEDMRQSLGSDPSRVKRRPLPSNPNSRHVIPDTIPQPVAPGRAKHGPRDLRAPPRANSMPPETMTNSDQQYGYGLTQAQGHPCGISPPIHMHQIPPNQQNGEYDSYPDTQPSGSGPYDEPQQLDFLPQLPPSNRQRGSLPFQPQFSSRQGLPMNKPRPQSHIGLPHSNSSPAVPLTNHVPSPYEADQQLRIDHPEPIPDIDYQHNQLGLQSRRNDVNSDGQSAHSEVYTEMQAFVEEEDTAAPPPPPMHSISAPVVPHLRSENAHSMSSPASMYSGTPPSGRHHSVPNSSPLQNIERTYGTPHRTPVHVHPTRGASLDGYPSSPEAHSHGSSPLSHLPGQTSSPYSRPQPASRPLPQRHSIAEQYQLTPPRPHPLSQEVPRSRSPQPPHMQKPLGSSTQPYDHSSYRHDYRAGNAVPLVKPRAVSPQPAQRTPQSDSASRPKSPYSIQHPVRAFESSDNSPLSTSRPTPGMDPASTSSTLNRKSVLPNPPTPTSAGGGMPFSPDSFDVHNPHARSSTLQDGKNPYQVRPGSEAVPHDGTSGPIVGFHGQVVDPSDHLPVDSWAPEPEVKVPTKTYGLGRDREFGPRDVQNGFGSGGRNLSKDTVVNVRVKPQQLETTSFRNRLQKKSAVTKTPVVEPLADRHNYNSGSIPDPYSQQEYSSSFYQSNERGYQGYGSISASPTDALSREISNIDIGSGRHSRTGSVPSPTAYVPVRSHRDRNTFY